MKVVTPLIKPFVYSCIAFFMVGAITFFIAQEEKQIRQQKDADELNVAMNRAKDKFRNILYADIDVANTLSIIYKQYGFRNNFDSIAADLMHQSKYAEVLQLTVDGVITHVYPIKGYEQTIGLKVAGDSLREKEYQRAKEKKEIFFAGPRMLRAGGTGILGKVPVIIGDSLQALAVVLTSMETIQKAMNISGDSSGVYSYQLVKSVPGADTTSYFLTATHPSPASDHIITEIPEGDWKLVVSFGEGYEPKGYPLNTLAFGCIIALLTAVLIFRASSNNYFLNRLVKKRTHELGERVKELTTVYKVSELLQHEEADTGKVMMSVLELIPPGWQYPEVCEARITIDSQTVCTPGYVESESRLVSPFKTVDGREGELEVVYTEARLSETGEVFLAEERDLLNALAELLRQYYDKKYHIEQKQKTEAQFRIAFEYASVAESLVSLEGKWISVNKALCDMVGYTEQELAGRSVSEITHPDDVEGDVEFIRDAKSGRTNHHRREKRYIHKDGSTVWVHLNVVLIKDGETPLYFVGQMENITAKREADMKFQNLVERSMVGVYIVQDNRFAYINPRIAQQSGYTLEELSSMEIDRFVHPEDVPKVMENIKARLSSEIEGVRYEVRAFRKNGEMLWLQMFGNVTTYQGRPAIIGTMVNITEQKRVFNELVNSEANLRTVFDTTNVSYMLLNDKLQIVTVNNYFSEAYKKQTGFSLSVGAYFPDHVVPSRREKIYNNCMKALETGKSVFEEAAYPNADGSVNYYESNFMPVISNGKVIGLCYSGIDVTSRKRAEVERQNLLAERLQIIEDLTRRNRELEQFSYIISHNVRGPVATISGLTQIAGNGMFPMEDRVKAMTNVQVSMNNLDNVLKDLNEILAVRQGKAEQKTEISLQEMMHTARVALRHLEEQYRPEYTCNFDASPVVYGIRSYVQNIFYNMLSNAMKYSRPYTTPEISVWTEVNGDDVVLHFSDNGLGIDLEKHREHIFGLYKRFHMASDGKGMGLFMVKTQIESMGGRVEVESIPGGGAHFSLVFNKVSETVTLVPG